MAAEVQQTNAGGAADDTGLGAAGFDEYVEDDRKDLGRQLLKFHPEIKVDTIESVASNSVLMTIPPSFKNRDGQVDGKHRSVPYLLQYEKTRILGFRTNQLSQGARPYIQVPEHVTNVREIARMELEARRLPIILKRPMPDGSFEYWRLSDLLIL